MSHAKAATAGSNLRQAAGLDRIFRGAFATRGDSPRAKGSGASSHGRFSLLALAALVLLALVAFAASVASGAVATEHVRSFGPDGTEATDFGRVSSVAVDQGTGAVYVLDGEAGVLHKFDAKGQPLDFTGTALYISGNEISGLDLHIQRNESQVAVDSASHVVYVTEKDAVRAFQADGEAAKFTAGPAEGTSELPDFGRLNGVAVDANGAIYASDNEAGTVSVYASTGAPLTSFAIPKPGNLGVGPSGTVYVVNSGPEGEDGGVHKRVPSEFPVTATTTYTAGLKLEKTSGAFTFGVGVDSVTGDVYVLEWNGPTWVKKFDNSGSFVRFFGKPGEEAELAFSSQGIAVVGGGEEFQFYVGNTEPGTSSKVEIFGEVITPGPPSVRSTSALDVASDSATLQAEVNPNTFATVYRFEYGLGDCSANACESVPLSDAPIGSGHRFLVLSQTVAGLQSGTTYHYRVVAENSEGVTEAPDHTFTTQVSGLGFELADDRAWEMVSPPKKFGGVLVGSVKGLIQTAADGEGIAYLSRGSIEPEPEGNRSFEASTILAHRGVEGWRSKDITPPNTHTLPLTGGQLGEYSLFSPDLSRALIEHRDITPLSEQASERTPYLRENAEPANYTPLVTGKEGFANVPPGTEFGGSKDVALGPVRPAGSTSDLSHVALSSVVPLTTGAPDRSLYMWSAGQLEPIAVLPAGEGGGFVNTVVIGSGSGSLQHAISEDGSRVFWATGSYGTSSNALTALYLRDMEADETARLDVAEPGASGAGTVRPVFQGASADGTVVFFTDSRQLTEAASTSGRDLYRCEIPPGTAPSGCATLTDISVPAPGESAEVLGIRTALSEDGSRIYFVAKGVLDEAPNQQGESAVPGEPNLYLWQEGEGTRFVVTLDEADDAAWGLGGGPVTGLTVTLNAAGSPSGRYLSFMSRRSLTGYDNRDASSQVPLQEAFRYDAIEDRLDCVSCNPTGGRPEGGSPIESELSGPQVLWVHQLLAAVLPQPTWEGPGGLSFYQPRSVLDNGRVFFSAFDALVPADSNSEWDVYQYEPTGVGDCTASSGGPAIARSAGGCVSLISSGTAEEEAGFLDASASGEDVFFLTSSRLSVADEDSELDVYDARVDGVPATLKPSTECLGEACQSAASAPNDPTPASASFRGQGNQRQSNARKRCAKGKRAVRRNGRSRCVKRKASRSRASKGRRASR